MNIQNKLKINSLKNNFIALIAFALPLSKVLMPILLVILLLLWLIDGSIKEKASGFKSPIFWFAISFYCIHIFGMLYTANTKAGSFDLEQKLSLLIFPMLFFTSAIIESKVVLNTLKSYVLGCFLAGCICLLNASYRYYISGDADSFFYIQFSAIMHASYFAMYLCFALIVILFNDELIQNKLVKNTAILFFIVLIVLTSSKSGVFAMLLIVFAKFMQYVLVKKKYTSALLLLVVIGITAGAAYWVFPKSFERITQMKNAFTQSSNELNTTTSRIAIWKHAFAVIKDNYIIGVGTGDVKEALAAEYDKQTENQLIEKKLNAHNQYLQTFIALGLPGILGLLALLIGVVYASYRANMLDASLLVLLIGFNMLFESMLETQSGVIFIAFFLMLYFKIAHDKIQVKNNTIAE